MSYFISLLSLFFVLPVFAEVDPSHLKAMPHGIERDESDRFGVRDFRSHQPVLGDGGPVKRVDANGM